MDIQRKWTEHLRRSYAETRGEMKDGIGEERQNLSSPASPAAGHHYGKDVATSGVVYAAERPRSPTSAAEGRHERKSPSPSGKRQSSLSRGVSPPKRARTRNVNNDDNPADYDRGPDQRKSNRQLWDPNQDPPSSNPRHAEMIKQPDTRAISQEQLVAEVKGIYAGLVMVESKCIEVVTAQTSQSDGAAKLNKDQWHALIALHRTLLHEHHDFFLASQHPSASPALRRLAAKYAMPARMWRHGIHSFLELLRHNLPGSYEHMITFIYMAYSMMALLLETVPAFEETWIECLGDLGRYRMAIEDEDIRDREHWASVSRHWYSLASDKSPTTGRLYHHLGILSRPNAVLQLFYYTKSLCVEIPFASARESIMTLFDPILARTPNPQQNRLPLVELNLVKAHGILFSGKFTDELDGAIATVFRELDSHIARSSRRWIDAGYQIAISNICAIYGYGDERNLFFVSFMEFARKTPSKPETPPEQPKSSNAIPPSTATGHNEPAKIPTAPTGSASEYTKSIKKLPPSHGFSAAFRLFTGTYDIVCHRFGDTNVLAFIHATLVFVHHLTFCPDAMEYFASHFPWKLTATFLNTLLSSAQSSTASPERVPEAVNLMRLVESMVFPGNALGGLKDVAPEKSASAAAHRRKPLPEDYALRGFPWVETYFPKDWFDSEDRIDDDDKYFELPSMLEERKERIVWLGGRIAARGGGKWLQFDSTTGQFDAGPEFNESNAAPDIEGQAPTPVESIECE